MLRLIFVLATLLLTLGSASAVTLSPAQCRADDWQSVGKSDGYYGFSADRFGQYARTCAQYGVTPNPKLYRAGYATGLKLYCTLDRAASEGKSGNPYRKVCTGELGVSFSRVYAQAHKVYLARKRAAALNHEIDEMNRAPEWGSALAFPLFGFPDGFGERLGSVSFEQRKLSEILAEERLRLKALGIKG